MPSVYSNGALSSSIFRYLISFFVVFCLAGCEEEKDEPSFKRTGAVENLSYDSITDLYSDHLSRDMIDADGSRVCGYRLSGGLGFIGLYLDCWGTDTPKGTYVKSKTGAPVKALSIGSGHICHSKASHNGTGIYCEGNNADGQSLNPAIGTGIGSGHYTYQPKLLTSGDRHNCVVDLLGVYCWGNNSYGQTSVPEIVSPIFLASAENHNCVVDAAKSVTCWGDNSSGQTDVPEGLIEVNYLALGKDFSCALHGSNNDLQCWGNTQWQNPIPEGSNGYEYISAGDDHICAVDQDNIPMIACWGNNTNTQLNVPAIAQDRVRNVVSGDGFSCAAIGYEGYPLGVAEDDLADGVLMNTTHEGVLCWGDNSAGQYNVPEFLCYGFHRSAMLTNERFCPPLDLL